MKTRNMRCVGLILIALTACLGLMAQSTVTGELVGTVTDPSGASVTTGKVTLQSDASNTVLVEAATRTKPCIASSTTPAAVCWCAG